MHRPERARPSSRRTMRYSLLEEVVRSEFFELYAMDLRTQGVPRSLAAFKRRFPGHEPLIERLYLRLGSSSSGAGAS